LIDLDGLITVIALSPDLETGLAAMGSATSSSSANVPWNVVGPGRSPRETVESVSEAATSFGGGIHRVNLDIQPGTYRNTDSSEVCFWARLSGFGGELDDTIANGNSSDVVIVTISATDVGFESERCGSWIKIQE
jgi:hypothetical protein